MTSKLNLTLFHLFISAFLFSQVDVIEGTVFEDSNNNGHKDKNEIGIQNVVVSDQIVVTTTDKDGNFSIQASSHFPYLFISLPTGYTGDYYYPKMAHMQFPLRKINQKDHFKFIHASDTHVDSLNLPRMARFRELADSVQADFIVISGDLIRDALRTDEKTASNYFEMYLKEIKKFGVPVYSGVGNHEIFGIERDKSLISTEHPLYGKKMFRSYLGPNYYSFNYGNIHFLSLDVVDYQNLYYYGGIDSLQLNWLEKDLEKVPQEMSIVTFNHIPFVSPGFSFQNFENDIFYGPQLLLQNDTLRHRHIVYNFNEVQKRIGKRHYPLALSGHYHSAQEGSIHGTKTLFVQTSAITRPDTFNYYGFIVRSGFTVYEVKNGKISSGTFVPLNFP